MRLLPNLAVFLFSILSVVSQPSFLSVDIQPAPLIEWDQTPYTFYTGQTMNITWLHQGFSPTDFAKITYPGAGGTRTLTTGSGVLVNASSYKVRLSDSANGLATNIPLTVSLSTNTSIFTLSSQPISILQSKLMTIVPFDGNRTLGGGQNTVCDDRVLRVSWRGLGEAQFGVASITLNRQGGFGGSSTLGTQQTNLPVSGNTSITFVCPRSANPSTFNSYAFQISVQESGGNAYTGTSASFNVAVAATPTPTPSQTPTSSKTPTSSNTPTPSPSATPSPTPSITPSISVTSTQTPSGTSSQTPTISTTETARPSIDYAGLARAAASQVDTTTPAIAGAFGGIGGILMLVGAFKWYQNKQMTERRKQKLAMTSRFVQQANSMYGIHDHEHDLPSTQQSIVMYTVASLPQRKTESNSLTSIKKGFTPKPTSK